MKKEKTAKVPKEWKIPYGAEKYARDKIMPEILLGAVISLVCCFLPYLSYTYKKAAYTISGFELITGKLICGGKTEITTNLPMLLILVSAVIMILAAIAVPYIKKRAALGFSAVAAIVNVAMNIYLASAAEKIIENGKHVGVSAGSIINIVVGIALVVRLLFVLWKLKIISALDFMAIPGMLYFVINNYIPMVGIAIAFKKVDYSVGIFKSPWCGLDNFKQLFASSTGSFLGSDAFLITRNTLLYNMVFIILGTVMGVIVGICLADIVSKFWQKFFQTSILLPQLISYVIVAYIVYALLSNETGLVNHILGDNAVNFYAAKKFWPFILVFIYIWKMIGYNAIIFLSSIVGIDKSIFEAARVDGANHWQRIRHITLPLLKPTIMTLFMLNIGRIMYSDFGLFYQVPMDSGALYSVTNTIDTYVYRCLMTLNNISTSSAACTYQAVIGFILVLAVNMIVRRKDKENALF